jgi:hypothetical protein
MSVVDMNKSFKMVLKYKMQTNEKTITLSSANAGGDIIEEYYDFIL